MTTTYTYFYCKEYLLRILKKKKIFELYLTLNMF